MAAENQDALKRAVASADVCALLSAAFSFPDEELAQALVSGTFAEDFRACLSELGTTTCELASLDALRADGDATTLFSTMRREYSRLYLIPATSTLIYPYESAFLHRAHGREGIPALFISPITKDVEGRMRRCDALPENVNREPVDHIACELDFLRLLYASLANALYSGSDEAAEAWRAEIASFTSEHLDSWVPGFMEHTLAHTRTPVYLALAQLALVALASIHPQKED